MFTAAAKPAALASSASCSRAVPPSLGRLPRSACGALPRPAGAAASSSATPCSRRAQPQRTRAAGGGVLDSPTITTPTYERGTESSKKKPPIYKVMLHNDNYNRREYVVKILLKTVDGLTVDDAVNVMQEAHETGVALVVACGQDRAEAYVETLRLNGLISTMEPGH